MDTAHLGTRPCAGATFTAVTRGHVPVPRGPVLPSVSAAIRASLRGLSAPVKISGAHSAVSLKIIRRAGGRHNGGRRWGRAPPGCSRPRGRGMGVSRERGAPVAIWVGVIPRDSAGQGGVVVLAAGFCGSPVVLFGVLCGVCGGWEQPTFGRGQCGARGVSSVQGPHSQGDRTPVATPGSVRDVPGRGRGPALLSDLPTGSEKAHSA